ncbi:(d)CMP kinase [Rubrivirga sp. S365]|uniref:Cytidylate kinase n=1 Tax=Rubrivirga litoralis TaxID=3075598 RepID=A0ABU3BNU9_9BACT|nr:MULTISPECIES: (d)CMP kinase [unclassified Rubrivirga]MDT0630967.1 (d)CMP kinase [Rubrivirga sp. F394]MDT7856610.1 (d)CMP kinase [Rubrivirga sp. S365]
MIVALDGPAGSGKSTTARRVAERLGWLYLDTGAMYRAVGVAFRDRGLPFTAAAARDLLPALDVRLRPAPDRTRVALDGVDVTDRIRTAQAAEDASRVSKLAPVREAMVALQRTVARETDAGGVVAEGRDVGTVVFPDADVKFFLVADLDARARRRLADFAASDAGGAGSGGDPAAFEKVRAEIAERDRRDESRALAPLRPAPDARRLDTTALSVEDQVDEVLRAVRDR